ncbi:HhH-GPD-type base excision DNA repair protein [Kitasatospora purpeofusca]|uniref:HhH-GPD-type base excision DNA repair protein n=1 Tax=Kitasatospora purpeofusca TaxID=67352 RepID=UPI002E0D1862
MDVALRIAQDPEADALLSRSPLALLVGALLDNGGASPRAFTGPLTIARRLGWEDLDAHRIADHSPGHFAAALAARPAVHDRPALTARRLQEMCRFLVVRHGGRAAAVWEGVPNGRQLLGRVGELPGFGRQKSKIFVALLGKRCGVRPEGWREAADPFGEDGVHRSVADVTGPHDLQAVTAYRLHERLAARAARANRAPGTSPHRQRSSSDPGSPSTDRDGRAPRDGNGTTSQWTAEPTARGTVAGSASGKGRTAQEVPDHPPGQETMELTRPGDTGGPGTAGRRIGRARSRIEVGPDAHGWQAISDCE